MRPKLDIHQQLMFGFQEEELGKQVNYLFKYLWKATDFLQHIAKSKNRKKGNSKLIFFPRFFRQLLVYINGDEDEF